MNVNTDGFRKARILPTTDGSAYILDLMNGTSWQGANVLGFPCPGLDEMDMGLLPEQFRESAAGAAYVVKHYETPIAWRLPSGEWIVPDVPAEDCPVSRVDKRKVKNYSTTTATFRNNIIRALASQGIEPVTQV